VTEGWSIPEVPPNEALRLELEAFAEREGVGRLYDRLLETDPQAAAKIHPNNVRRVIRALEVYTETGEKISDLQRKSPPPYAILELGLRMERLNLYERADRRVDSMIEKGFLEEARYLLDSGYARTLPSMSGLGYGQLAAHILDNLPLETAIHDTKIATHDFIRRQLTWFRGHDNGILWHNVEGLDVYALTQFCVRWLNNEA
jgi:tRNA dimethylallyltransferase